MKATKEENLGKFGKVKLSILKLESTTLIGINSKKRPKLFIELSDFEDLIKELQKHFKGNQKNSNNISEKIANSIMSNMIALNNQIMGELANQLDVQGKVINTYNWTFGYLGLQFVAYTIGVGQDHESGESWQQAIVSRGVAKIAGVTLFSEGLKILGIGSVATICANPIGIIAGVVALCYLSGKTEKTIDSFIDYLYERVNITIKIDGSKVHFGGTENNLVISGKFKNMKSVHNNFEEEFLERLVKEFKVKFKDNYYFVYNTRDEELNIVVKKGVKKYIKPVEKVREEFPKWFKETLNNKKRDIGLRVESEGKKFIVMSINELKKLEYSGNSLKAWGYSFSDLKNFNSWLEEKGRISNNYNFVLLSPKEYMMSTGRKRATEDNEFPYVLQLPKPNENILYGSKEKYESEPGQPADTDTFEFWAGYGAEKEYEGNKNPEAEILLNGKQIGNNIQKDGTEFTETIYKNRRTVLFHLDYEYIDDENKLIIEYGNGDRLEIRNFANGDYGIYLPWHHIIKGSLGCEIKDGGAVYEFDCNPEQIHNYYQEEEYKSNGGAKIEIKVPVDDKMIPGNNRIELVEKKEEENEREYIEYLDDKKRSYFHYLYSVEENMVLIQYEHKSIYVPDEDYGDAILIEDFANGDYGLELPTEYPILYGSGNQVDLDNSDLKYNFVDGKKVHSYKYKTVTETANYIHANSNGTGTIYLNDNQLGDCKTKFVGINVQGEEKFRDEHDNCYLFDRENNVLTIKYGYRGSYGSWADWARALNVHRIKIKKFRDGDYNIFLPNKVGIISGSGGSASA